ncbi:cytochrome c oxidase subunit 3 [Fulvivirga sedimenti]|uniref:Cytochrome c oxidase subunit 3 n=1 Tax=Fulvivirga sedimenti TaxID=2879465 RepID=A0A9X1HMM9_9BACT|nr:cytochrome c oxidase subunit 3 [Fulvivirga sedimenti]MCA6073628.1 cytochrome c oxidase subunit 3 [Fulvivirga sedimenti]
MTSNIKIVEQPERPLAMNPKKFALWLFIITVVMIFASLTSAYIVRQAEGNWRIFELPVELYYTTAIIILSSITMQWAYMAAKKDALQQVKIAISITTVLGIMFLIGQFYTWGVLVDMKVNFTGGNPSESFLYVLMGVHALHLVSGVIFLIIVLISTFRYKVHSKNLNQIQMCNTYWHFLDILWVYLFLFLLLNN